MITGAAFCPHPPLLVPEVAQAAAAELDGLRAACRDAIRRVASSGAQLVVIGSAESWQHHETTASGSLAGYGVDCEIPLGSDEPGPVELPLSLTIGAWLLRDALGPNCGAVGRSVAAGRERLDLPTGPTALLVMGDGSGRRSTAAPGYLDERAVEVDAQVAAALAAGDPDRLAPRPELADELLVAGWPAWSAAAGVLAGGRWDAELLYDDAPYGVGYFVAAWTVR